jgi:hypothetical protein
MSVTMSARQFVSAFHLLLAFLCCSPALGRADETKGGSGVKDLADDFDMQDTCESCLAKSGGWCTSEQRCVEDDPDHCDVESLIGLAGFTNDCSMDEEGRRPKDRPWIDKGVFVQYTYENGTCCLGVGIVHRAYHVLGEYTVLLQEGSREEVKTERWNSRKPAKKKDENSEYHNIEFRYFTKEELTVVSGIRPGDVVQAHFAVKTKASDDALVKSRRTEEAIVVNTSVPTVAVNFTSDQVVSILPRDFIIDTTELTRPAHSAAHDEL